MVSPERGREARAQLGEASRKGLKIRRNLYPPGALIRRGLRPLPGAAHSREERVHPAIVFQFFARCSAVRQASACTVSVGLCAPLVPITDAPRIPRFGAS